MCRPSRVRRCWHSKASARTTRRSSRAGGACASCSICCAAAAPRTSFARSTTCRSRCGAANRSASSARTARASRRCSRSSPASCRPRAERSRSTDASARCSSSAAGFHPDYTGEANIDLAAALLGLAPAEIADKRDEIIAFADIGEHLRDPIKHYSSGMVVRLGFAVATALAPDILITDEVLAVGDESFQKKCIAWMERYLATGGTLLLCSHSMYHVQKLCRRALWIRDGRVAQYGAAFDVTQAYLAYHEEKTRAQRAAPIPQSRASAAGVYAVQTLTLDARGRDRARRRRSKYPARSIRRTAARRRCSSDRACRRNAGIRRVDRHGQVTPTPIGPKPLPLRDPLRRASICCPGDTWSGRMRSIRKACGCSTRSNAR